MLPGRSAVELLFSTRCYGTKASDCGVLRNRSVLRLSGRGLMQFLQKVISNDVQELEATGSPLLYACALNPQGRFLHDMFLQRARDSDPVLLADVDAHGKHELIKHLQEHDVHHHIDITDLSDSHSVWVRFGESGAADAALAAACGVGPPGGLGFRRDPRLPILGGRAIVENGSAPVQQQQQGADVWRAYRRWRVLQGVAEGDSEMPSGQAIPHEYNLIHLNGVNLHKGCYVGQEFVQRVATLGRVRKRLMPFTFEGAPPAEIEGGPDVPLDPLGKPAPMIFDIYDTDCLASVGRTVVVEGDVGLAVVRLHSALVSIAEGQPLYLGSVKGSHVPVHLHIPDWWPESFTAHVSAEEDEVKAFTRA